MIARLRELVRTFKGGGPQGQVWTWYGHGIATLLGAAVPAKIGGLLWFWWPTQLAAAAFATSIALAYVFGKEPLDKELHVERGTWHEPGALGITPLVDEWGDTIGPVFVALSAWTMWGIGL